MSAARLRLASAALLAAAGLWAIGAVPAGAGPMRTCRAELGAAEARSLVRDCLDSAPATPALCRLETPCEAMREMIAEACRVQGEDKPVCRALREDDEDDEE
ncbi:hypothetical protein [Enterovirga sp.]|uniref:hypothetical protein n=1 Tax=Enterovirga sp. TaxID=2026350 RepID=UPI002C5917BD|nr:hypothetical protein [Enterovirga sp.]HMO29681.1 hypothetical protein [Enterovirga sp.]